MRSCIIDFGSCSERTPLSNPTPTDVVATFNAAWGAGDVAAALNHLADDAVYENHVSDEFLPCGGLTSGRDNIGAVLTKVRTDFEYILYRPMTLICEGDTVRFQVEFMYRHRASGEVLSGRFRQVMQVKDRRIVRIDEYHDRAKVEAFMRLVNGSST